MSFFDPKENILEVILTQYGRKKLSEGDLRIRYCSFGDDEVDYGISLFAVSSSIILPPQLNLMVDWNPEASFIHLTGVGGNRIDILSNSAPSQNVLHLSQSTATLGPLWLSSVPEINNKPSIHFTGALAAPYHLEIGSGSANSIPVPWTLYAVIYPDLTLSSSADASSQLVDGFVVGHRNFAIYQQATQRWAVGNPTQANSSANTFVSGSWQAICWQVDGAGNGVFFGMSASVSPQTNFVSTMISGAMGTHNFGAGLKLGDRFSHSLGWNGQIARWLVYTGSHNQDQRNQVASFIAQYYGINITTG